MMVVSWGEAPVDEMQVMAEAIGSTAVSYLGGSESLKRLECLFFATEQRAEVWVVLRDNTVEGQLRAITAFGEVSECYEGEYAVSLHFGKPAENASPQLVSARSTGLSS